ncbi:MAG: lysophospholipid acyltransferase family protein [bacterium]|nr:lysophospholipid acyltransferase family protein [bacterium]
MPKKNWYYPILAVPLYLVALLPMRVLYLISDFARILVFHVFGYRKDVVFQNLKNSFPEKDENWIRHTAWKFYQNLFDTSIETIAMAVQTKSYYRKHVKLNNLDIISGLNQRQQPFILVCGHLSNWEYAGQRLQLNSAQVDVLYHPLSNKFFDWFMYHVRTRFYLHLIPMQSALREMLQRKNIPSAITFIADQTPSRDGCHWMQFLNQDTPVFLGVEKMAKKFNYPVVYGDIFRAKRGNYVVNFQMLTEHPKDLPEFEITEKHMQLLEQSIRYKPEDWLWSHRRWKHQKPIQK